jgi:hypothetical protein
MGLEGVVKNVCGYTKAFVKLFLENEYPYVKFVDDQDFYSKEPVDSRDHVINNIYKNNLNKTKGYRNGRDD